MKVAVVCSNGKVGKLVVAEAQAAGLEVTGFARGENKSGAKNFVQKDLFALTKDDLAGFDVVVDAFGAWAEPDLPNHSKSLAHLCDLLSGTKTRLIVVGGAGSLYVNKEHTAQVMDGESFPDAFKPLASAQGKALSELRKRDDVQWTFISPGESIISYADYAAALVEEIVKGKHIKERISLVRA